MEKLVEIVGVTKAYDANHVAVNNVTLTLPKGKIIGLLVPTEGNIKIAGFEIGAVIQET